MPVMPASPYLPAGHQLPYMAADTPYCTPWYPRLRAPEPRGLEDHSSGGGGHGVWPQDHVRPATGSPQGPEQNPDRDHCILPQWQW